MRIINRTGHIVALLLCLLSSAIAHAQMSSDAVVLSVTGLGETYTYDVVDLAQIAEETIETTTIWTDGVQSFSGVPLKAFLAHLGVESGIMTATAVNDYSVTFPVEEALIDGPLIAYSRNGAPMSLRDKGPLWIVYPYDSDPTFQNEVVHARSVWQLDRISFKPE